MADKKKPKTADETYDERARSLMKAIETRRSDRALDAPARRLDERIRAEKGRATIIGDLDPFFPTLEELAFRMTGRRPSPGAEYYNQEPRTKDAVRPTLQGNPMRATRSSWNGLIRDFENDEGISGLSGTPGELLPPYRARTARRIADDYEDRQRVAPRLAEKMTREDLENLALESRKATPPVTQYDIDAMREALVRPGETSNVRDPIDMMPNEAQWVEKTLRGSAEWLRAHPRKKKGK